MSKKTFFGFLLSSSLLSSSFAGSVVLAHDSQADACCQSSNLNARVQSAQEILDDISNLKTSINTFHHQADMVIAQSRKLQGEAELLRTKTPILPAYTKLTPAQLQAATKQYNSDLQQFALHAGAYEQNLKTFQATIGECHANENALNSVIKKYELHVDQFHSDNLPASIRPPHICRALKASIGDTSHLANSMMMDQKKLLEAQLELAKAEGTLQNSENEAVGTRLKATNEARREEGEQALAAEFSRLKDEYDLLKVEKDRLAGNHSSIVKVTHSSVSAKIKKN